VLQLQNSRTMGSNGNIFNFLDIDILLEGIRRLTADQLVVVILQNGASLRHVGTVVDFRAAKGVRCITENFLWEF